MGFIGNLVIGGDRLSLGPPPKERWREREGWRASRERYRKSY